MANIQIISNHSIISYVSICLDGIQWTTLVNVTVMLMINNVCVVLLLQSKAFLQTAASLAPHMYEPHFNLATLSEKVTPFGVV